MSEVSIRKNKSKLVFNFGKDGSNSTYTNIDTEASDEDLFTTADGIAKFQARNVESVRRIDEFTIIQR